MTYWSLRTEDLQEPHSRHALLQSLIFALERSQPDLLALVRKMVEIIDEAEGELEREKDRLQEVIADLENEIEDLEAEIGEMRE